MAKVSKAEREAAIERLKEVLKPGDTLWLRLGHVAPSGMSRIITPMLFRVEVAKVTAKDGAGESRGLYDGGGGPQCISLGESELHCWYPGRMIRAMTGWGGDNDQGVKMSGAGMDMGMHMVSYVSGALFGDERALKYRWL